MGWRQIKSKSTNTRKRNMGTSSVQTNQGGQASACRHKGRGVNETQVKRVSNHRGVKLDMRDQEQQRQHQGTRLCEAKHRKVTLKLAFQVELQNSPVVQWTPTHCRPSGFASEMTHSRLTNEIHAHSDHSQKSPCYIHKWAGMKSWCLILEKWCDHIQSVLRLYDSADKLLSEFKMFVEINSKKYPSREGDKSFCFVENNSNVNFIIHFVGLQVVCGCSQWRVTHECLSEFKDSVTSWHHIWHFSFSSDANRRRRVCHLLL